MKKPIHDQREDVKVLKFGSHHYAPTSTPPPHKPDLSPLPGHVRVVVDSREQTPYTFRKTATVRRALRTGDYSLDRLNHLIGIERKSAADLCATLHSVRRRQRFARECKRMQVMIAAGGYACIVVECDFAMMAADPPPKPDKQRSPYNIKATWAHLRRLSVRYGIPVWTCRGRAQAQAWTLRLLADCYRELAARMEPVEAENS